PSTRRTRSRSTGCSPIAERNTAGCPITTSTSCTWPWRTSTTRGRRPRSPQTNGICERFHKTMLNEFYRVAFRKKIYTSLEQLQADLDAWLTEYNETRPHQGRWCFGKTPMQTLRDSVPLAKEKLLVA